MYTETASQVKDKLLSIDHTQYIHCIAYTVYEKTFQYKSFAVHTQSLIFGENFPSYQD